MVIPTPADNAKPLAGLSDAIVPLGDDGTPSAFVDPESGAVHVQTEDGGVIVDFDPDEPEDEKSKDFDRNLALDLDEDELNRISADLLEGIQADIDSRKQWEQNLSNAMTQLGLQPEKRSNIDLDTISKARHPLLLEVVLDFWSNFVAEFLPADGPVKVRADNPEDQSANDEADALEHALNHYLTVTATEYYPDTSRGGFRIGFIGGIVKKVFYCGLRRRPVSESVYLEDLIVSNEATDLDNAKRVTHRMMYLAQDVKAMQVAKLWCDVTLGEATDQESEVRAKIAQIQGTQPNAQRPEDKQHTIYECHTKRIMTDPKAKKYTDDGLPSSYKITIDKDSMKVLAIYRLWKEGDDLFRKKQQFVPWFYAPGLGFYPIGNAQILVNDLSMLTAMWREMADAGMFANFPGFLYLDSLGRQDTNRFRIPPAGGQRIKAPPGMKVQDCIMPVPYKDISAGLLGFAQHIEDMARKKAAAAKIPVGEGKTDIPVGSLLMFIEQSTKMMQAVHKGLHTAQKREFELLKELFVEDPEALTRFNDDPKQKTWTAEELKNHNLVPASDPNTPSHVHRLSIALAMFMMATQAPGVFVAPEVAEFIMETIKVPNPQRFIAPPQAPSAPPPDPKAQAQMAAVAQKAQAEQRKAANEAIHAQQDQVKTQQQAALDTAEMQSKERIANMQNQTEHMRLQIEENRAQREHAEVQFDNRTSLAADLTKAHLQHEQKTVANQQSSE